MASANDRADLCKKSGLCKASVRAVQGGDKWFKSLNEDGWNGLFPLIEPPHCTDILQQPGLREEMNGVRSSQWKKRQQSSGAQGVAHEDIHAVGMHELKNTLSSNSVLANAMNVICGMLSTLEGEKLSNSAPQLFVANTAEGPQQKADSWNYLQDEKKPLCRCFLYLGVEEEEGTNTAAVAAADEEEDEDVHHYPHCFACGTADGALKEFGEKKALTMKAAYSEAHKKFRLHAGDLVVMKNCNPFAVELPVFSEGQLPRLFSWSILPASEGMNSNEPRDVSYPAPIPFLEDKIGLNAKAREYYDVEMRELAYFAYASKDIGEVFPYMERFRITPGIYDMDEFAKTVRDSRTISDITTWVPN